MITFYWLTFIASFVSLSAFLQLFVFPYNLKSAEAETVASAKKHVKCLHGDAETVFYGPCCFTVESYFGSSGASYSLQVVQEAKKSTKK